MWKTLRILCVSLVFLIPACQKQSEVTVATVHPPTTTTTMVDHPPPTAPSTTTTIMITQPKPKKTVTSKAYTSPAVSYPSSGNVWDIIAKCEAGGNWTLNTGNGYYGGLQEDMDFWRLYGHGVAPRPDLASREQQIAAAEEARDSGRGYSPWPKCRHKAGV